MNRVGLGLAVGAGYILGRTKKAKLAFALGTLAAGRRMNLSPRAVRDLLSRQLQENPQFKEMTGQLREDMRGAGKAASGALLERQIEGLAGRLHGRTAQVRDRLAKAAPDATGDGAPEAEEPRDREGRDERDERDTDEEYGEAADQEDQEEEPEEEPPGPKTTARKSTAGKPDRKPAAKNAPAKKPAAKKAAGRGTAEKKAPARKAPAKKAAARKAPREAGRERGRGR